MNSEPVNGKSNYQSSVPKYAFSNDLANQEKELEENDMLERFRASRAELSADPYRPAYHYVNPESRLNDPNGLCCWQGRWHLFYQGYPPEDPRQHWGHAVSDDLIRWRDLPYAIYPDPERCCFSGATLVEEDRVIAMYHGTEAGNMVATSSDPLLLNWEKLTGGPVIPMQYPDGSERPYQIFDPCIWRKEEFYYSLSAGLVFDGPGGKGVRGQMLFRSKDLVHWEKLHEFVEGDEYSLVGDDGACPYFWPIGKKHMLLHFSHMSGGKYLLGDYDTDRDKFSVTDGGRFNFGAATPSGIHAPSATPDGKGGIIAIFNMNTGKPTEGWDQIMSLPRRLTLDESTPFNPIRVEPAGEIESLRGEHKHFGKRTLAANEDIVLDGIESRELEIEAVFQPSDATVLEMNVLRSADGKEKTRILFYRNRGFQHREVRAKDRDSIIAIDLSESSLLPEVQIRPPECAPVYLRSDEALSLRVFVDRSVVEVFVNGRQCVATRVYPSHLENSGISIISRGNDTLMKSLDAWRSESIYQNHA